MNSRLRSPRERQSRRRHGRPQPVQRRHRVVVQDGSKRPVEFVIRVRIDHYLPQTRMQRGVSPQRRVYREAARLRRSPPQTRSARRAAARAGCRPLLFSSRASATSASRTNSLNRRSRPARSKLARWSSVPGGGSGGGRSPTWRALVRVPGFDPSDSFGSCVQLGDATVLPTARTVGLDDVDQTSRRVQVCVGECPRPHRPGRILGRETGVGCRQPGGRRRSAPSPTSAEGMVRSCTSLGYRSCADATACSRISFQLSVRHDTTIRECCDVLREVHEPGGHLIEKQLLLGAGERPAERDQSVELIYRHEGGIPGGVHEQVERADDLPARNPACADGMLTCLLQASMSSPWSSASPMSWWARSSLLVRMSASPTSRAVRSRGWRPRCACRRRRTTFRCARLNVPASRSSRSGRCSPIALPSP